MADTPEAFAIHDIEFVELNGHTKAIGLKIISGPGEKDKRHMFLAAKETWSCSENAAQNRPQRCRGLRPVSHSSASRDAKYFWSAPAQEVQRRWFVVGNP
jgi:hypothetical protein